MKLSNIELALAKSYSLDIVLRAICKTLEPEQSAALLSLINALSDDLKSHMASKERQSAMTQQIAEFLQPFQKQLFDQSQDQT